MKFHKFNAYIKCVFNCLRLKNLSIDVMFLNLFLNNANCVKTVFQSPEMRNSGSLIDIASKVAIIAIAKMGDKVCSLVALS
ncbi:hypothetical protein FDUTEX481_05012 [Tolypothrix sp. PCC 7601]|nr:hypothetical protein FDUTEX481_05012 [Tolypothrix sp. PCC 7601]